MPPVLFELQHVIVGNRGERQLDRLPRSLRQVKKVRKLEVLAPLIGLAAKPDHPLAAAFPPLRDRGEAVARRDRRRRPEVEHDRLPRGQVAEIRPRQQAVRTVQVLSEREMVGVGADQFPHPLVALAQPHLRQARIGLQIHAPRAAQLIVLERVAGGQVDDRFRFTEEPRQIGGREIAERAARSDAVGAADPAPGESVLSKDWSDHHARPVGIDGPVDRMGHPVAAPFDVIDLEAETIQADQVVQHLPDDAGHRLLAHPTEHDQLRLMHWRGSGGIRDRLRASRQRRGPPRPRAGLR